MRQSDVVYINRQSLRGLHHNRNSSINIRSPNDMFGKKVVNKLDASARKTPSQVLLNYDNIQPQQHPPPHNDSSSPCAVSGTASISINRSSLLTPAKYPVLKFIPSAIDLNKKININYDLDDEDLDADDLL